MSPSVYHLQSARLLGRFHRRRSGLSSPFFPSIQLFLYERFASELRCKKY